MLALNTLLKDWLPSLSSLPPGETRVREQAVVNKLFNRLLS